MICSDQKQWENSQLQKRLAVARGGRLRGCAKWVKMYELPVIKEISPGEVTYSMVTIVNKTVLHV